MILSMDSILWTGADIEDLAETLKQEAQTSILSEIPPHLAEKEFASDSQ